MLRTPSSGLTCNQVFIWLGLVIFFSRMIAKTFPQTPQLRSRSLVPFEKKFGVFLHQIRSAIFCGVLVGMQFLLKLIWLIGR